MGGEGCKWFNENPAKKQTVSESDLKAVVMLQALTLDDIKSWEFMGKTPANREHYYNKDMDVAAYISNYGRKLQVYYNRKFNGENYAACFGDNVIIKLAP